MKTSTDKQKQHFLKDLFDKEKEEILLLTCNIQPQYSHSDEVIMMISKPNLFYLGSIFIYLIYLYLNFFNLTLFLFKAILSQLGILTFIIHVNLSATS